MVLECWAMDGDHEGSATSAKWDSDSHREHKGHRVAPNIGPYGIRLYSDRHRGSRVPTLINRQNQDYLDCKILRIG